MRFLIIGVDDCGSRLAGAFSDLNKRAKSERRVQIITNTYAVNNDKDSLAAVKAKNKEMQTILIDRSFIETGRSIEAAAAIMREEGGRVLSAVKPGDFYDTDAIVLIAGSAGNLGAGGVPVLAQLLKERHVGKPIYALIVLPFESEAAQQQCIYNTAICLKSVHKVSEAVFLVDNNRYTTIEALSSPDKLSAANKDIVLPFYDLLCTTENVDLKYAGARTMGIGDILQTLSGWTAISVGKTQFQMTKPFQKPLQGFQEKGEETQKIMEALTAALGQFTVDFKLEDAGKALYLLSVPAKGANVDMVKVLGNHLREITGDAEIRGGDFYAARDNAQVTLVISGLNFVKIVKGYYDKAVNAAQADKNPPGTVKKESEKTSKAPRRRKSTKNDK